MQHPSPFESDVNAAELGRGFDICIECHEYVSLPTAAHLLAAEEHIATLEMEWVEQCRRRSTKSADGMVVEGEGIPPRPPPHPSAVVHLPLPSSQQAVQAINGLIPVIRFLQRVVTPGWLSGGTSCGQDASSRANIPRTPLKMPRLPSPWSPNQSSAPGEGGVTEHGKDASPGGGRNGHAGVRTFPMSSYRPRPLKVLLYSSDGYTESSVPALCLLMAIKGLSLPEAYLELQVCLSFGYCSCWVPTTSRS